MKKYEWKKEAVEQAVRESNCYADALRKLSINLSGNNSATLKRKIEEYNIDTSHFTFRSELQPREKKDVTEYLTENSNIKSSKLKDKLIAAGLKENRCEECGCDVWRGKPITCQLHHVNGVNTDNRIENLKILCPNCHSQTDNYCGQANRAKNIVHYCSECGRPLRSLKSIYCPSCAAKRRKKVNLTSDELAAILKKHNGIRTKAAEELGVSETAIRKWCRKFSFPTTTKDLKIYLGI